MELPKGESLRRAVQFVSGRLREEPPPKLIVAVDEATLRFDLSPVQADFLIRFYREVRERGDAPPE